LILSGAMVYRPRSPSTMMGRRSSRPLKRWPPSISIWTDLRTSAKPWPAKPPPCIIIPCAPGPPPPPMPPMPPNWAKLGDDASNTASAESNPVRFINDFKSPSESRSRRRGAGRSIRRLTRQKTDARCGRSSRPALASAAVRGRWCARSVVRGRAPKMG
jgi:hypothetical protein